MKNMSRRQIVLCLAAVLASACVPRRVPLDPEFLKNPSHKVGVALTEHPVLAAHRVGAQGLLDMAVNAAVDGNLESHLKTIDTSKLHGLVDEYVGRLTQRGLQARRLDTQRLQRFKTLGHDQPSASEMKALAQEENVDSVLLITTLCGTIRPYYGFIPLKAPSAYCALTGRLIDLTSKRVEWVGVLHGEEASVPVKGEWDQAPDFPNLTAAVHKAIAQAHDYLLADFFEGGAGTASPAHARR